MCPAREGAMSENGSNPEITSAVADTEPPDAVLVDEACFLCVGIPRAVPKDLDAATFYYAFGFAEGVSQALRSMGYHLCDSHHAVIRKACVERGINWGKPERRIVG